METEGKLELLAHRGVLSVFGQDRVRFLQSIMTNDVSKCADGMAYSLLLTPQGRFLYDFFMIGLEDSILLEYELEYRDDILKLLNKYKLRADVKIFDASDEYRVVASPDEPNKLQGSFIYPDPRLKDMGFRGVVKVRQNVQFIDSLNYDIRRISLGVAEGCKDLTFGKSFPLEYGMDLLNAFSFQKGCYVGQEVTARTKYRGTVRKKIFILEMDELPPKGSDVIIEGEALGIMCSRAQNIGLALLRSNIVYSQLRGIKLPKFYQLIALIG